VTWTDWIFGSLRSPVAAAMTVLTLGTVAGGRAPDVSESVHGNALKWARSRNDGRGGGLALWRFLCGSE